MNAVKEAIGALTKLPKSKRGDSEVVSCLQQLSNVPALLSASSLSANKCAQLSDILRIQLQPLYRLDVSATLVLCESILQVLHKGKVLPLLKKKDKHLARPWEAVEVALISGMLDFLEENEESRKTFSGAINPIICASFFQKDSSQVALLDENLLATAYLFLTETLEVRQRDVESEDERKTRKLDVESLREQIGSEPLGQTILRIKDFLALEAILNLLGKLISTVRKREPKHMAYLREVFNESIFKCSPQILKLFDVLNPDWNTVSMDIMRVLAAFDKSFPQHFSISSFTVEEKPLPVANPFIVDKIGFTCSLEQEEEDEHGTLGNETLQVPFSCIREAISVVALDKTSVAIELKVTRPPLLGRVAMALPDKESYRVNFKLKKIQEKAFVAAIKHRKLPTVYPAVTSKLSQAPSELLEGIKSDEKPLAWMNKANVLARMASPLQSCNPGDDEEDHDDSSGSDHVPRTVFVQRDGTLSATKVDDEVLGLVNDDDNSKKPKQENMKTAKLDRIPDEPVPRQHQIRRTNAGNSPISETDDGSEYQPTQVPKVKEEAAKKTSKTTYGGKGRQNPTAAKAMAEDEAPSKPPKRALKDLNIEEDDAGAAKRRRLTAQPQNDLPTKGRRSSISKPVTLDDLEDLPEPAKVPPKPRARAMKGKNGKPAATAKPVPTKKARKPAETSSDPIIVEPSEPIADNVERRSLRSSTAQTTQKSKMAEKPVSKKVKKAPWEEADFIKLKEESSDHIVPDDFGLDPVNSTDHELSETLVMDEAPFGDKYVDSMEPTKGADPVSAPHVRLPPLKEVVTIDLTSSPPVSIKKASLQPEKVFVKPLQHIPVYSLVTTSNVLKEQPSTKSALTTHRTSRMKSPVRHQPDHRHFNEAVSKHSHAKLALEPESPITRRLESKFKLDDSSTARRSRAAVPDISRLDEQRSNSKPRKTERRSERLPSPPPPPKVYCPQDSDNEDGREKMGRLPTPPLQNWKQQDERTSPLLLKSTPVRKDYELRKNSAPDHRHRNSRDQYPQYEGYGRLDRGRGRRRLDDYVQEDPMDKIAGILGEITDVIIHRTETKFTSIPKELRISEAQARQQFVNGMREVNNELVRHYNVMFDLDAEYNKISEDILKGLRSSAKASNEMALACRRVIQENNRNSLCKKFTATLAPDRPSMAILADPSLGFPAL